MLQFCIFKCAIKKKIFYFRLDITKLYELCAHLCHRKIKCNYFNSCTKNLVIRNPATNNQFRGGRMTYVLIIHFVTETIETRLYFGESYDSPYFHFPADHLPVLHFPADNLPSNTHFPEWKSYDSPYFHFAADRFPADHFPADHFLADHFSILYFPADHIPVDHTYFPENTFPRVTFPRTKNHN
jgi:hypothetical protein